MLVLKKLFSGNYLKKLHIIKNSSLIENIESNIIEEEKGINGNKINNLNEEINNDNKFYLISIYESSLDITYCEYDSIIKQYIQTPILHQNFFFIIFDSEIIDSKIVLLTSIGLFLYNFEKNKLELLIYDIFNIKCEPKDLLMYLKINQKLNLILVYSNTNLFFLYQYEQKSNKFNKINQISKLCNGYINYLNIFNIDQVTNYFIISIQMNISNNFSVENYIYYIDKDKSEISEIELNKLNDDNNDELIVKKSIGYINNIFNNINENYKEEKIKAIRYDLFGKYIFIIINDGFIILKYKQNENEKDNNIIDLMMKFKFKYGQNSKSSFFIEYQKIKNYHFLFFDNKISIFEEKNEILSRIKLITKEQKKFLTNSNAIFQGINNNNEISMISYNYKNDMTFIKLNKEEKEENINIYKINIITKITNESMFCLDGIISKNNKDEYKITSICGLQGESRLVKYSNIFNEIVLHKQEIDSQINSIIFPLYNFRHHYFSNIFITSNNNKSILYTIDNTFQTNHLINFESPALKLYPLLNNLNYIIILKSGVGLFSFNEENNLKNYNIKNLYECQNNKEENDNNNPIYILFSYYFIFKGQEYLVIYLNNRHLLCFNINSLNNIFDIELNNIPQPSALGVIAIERLNKLGFVLGNYTNNHIIIIYYDFEKNCFDEDKKNVTKLLDSTGNSLLTPDDILIYKYYIFITTHTGDFIVLNFNDNNLDNSINVIYNLENITKNKISLKFSQIDYYEEKNEFNIDFYSFKNAYNIILNISNDVNNEIICTNKNQLTKYKFNETYETPLLQFQKIFLNEKGTKIHFYFIKKSLSFSFFQEQLNKNNISIETLYNFQKDEKAIKIIPITERNGEILVLTNNLKLYLFNEDSNLILTKNIANDVKKEDLKILGVKNYLIKEDDEGETTNINIIILFGGFKSNENKTIGILIVYQFIDTNLIPIKIITGYPKSIIDACFIKRYIICGIEAALCVREYFVRNNSIEWNQDVRSLMISNYMNKITNLVPLNNFCNNYYLLTSDIYESFQLIKFNSISPEKYETLGADLSLNNLGNIYPVNNNKEEIFTTDKKGIITKYELKDEIYTIVNRVDLKEYIMKLFVENNNMIMVGLLGSVYFGKIIEYNDTNNNNELLKFQKDVFNEICNINLKKSIEFEEAMLMNEKINNVLLVDILINFCEIYYNELSSKINNFQNLFNHLGCFAEEILNFKIE